MSWGISAKTSWRPCPRRGRLTPGLKIQGTFLELAVTDTGHGMPPEKMALLFYPFFSNKEGGAGLGPAICRELIGQYHGEISIDSKVDRGALVSAACR